MALVNYTVEDDIAIVKLDNGVTNAINPTLIKDMESCLRSVQADSKGMVLCGGEKFFSIGFDLPHLIQLDRAGFLDFWQNFNRMFFAIYTLPLPTISAIQGHAVAGGAVMSLATDFRLGCTGKKQFGLNEIKLGIPIPYSTDLVLRQLVGDRVTTQMAYSGDFQLQENATGSGLIDSVAEPEEVMSQAITKIAQLAKHTSTAFTAIKSCRTGPVKQEYDAGVAEKDSVFLDIWFDPVVQDNLTAAAATF